MSDRDTRKINGLSISSFDERLMASISNINLEIEALKARGFIKFVLTGTDGDFVDGERVGSVIDFELPAECNINKAMIVIDGLQIIEDYTVDEVNTIKYIHYSIAPLANSFIFYQL